MPVGWYGYCREQGYTHDNRHVRRTGPLNSKPPGRPQRNRKQIKARRKAARR